MISLSLNKRRFPVTAMVLDFIRKLWTGWTLPLLSRLRELILFAAVTAATAYFATLYLVDNGSNLTTRHLGPWTIWKYAAQPDADPYTRAHFIRTGALPLSARVALTYKANTDAQGRKLKAHCEYAIEGTGPDAEWWSLAVYTRRGRLIDNPADRYTFTSDTVMRGPDGSYLIRLAREARAGNWLPTMRANKLQIILTVQHPNYTGQFVQESNEAAELPSIRRVACR